MDRSTKHQKKKKTFQSDDTTNYYRRIKDHLENEQDTSEEFLDNVFAQLMEEAIEVCHRKETSPVIENLVTKASATHLHGLLDIFSKDWSTVCRDRCSSHVLQKVLMVLPKYIKTKVLTFDFENPDCDDSVDALLIKLVLHLHDFLIENIEDSIKDTHMSHIFRGLMQLLGGTCVGEKVIKSKYSRKYAREFGKSEHQDTYKELSFADFEVPLESFGAYLTDTNACPVIQTLLLVLHKVRADHCQKVIHKVIKASRIEAVQDSANIPPVVVDNVGSYLVELIVSLSSEKLYKELYRKLFKGRLAQFATHPSANFVLQKFIKSCPDQETFDAILEELEAGVDEIFKKYFYGVLVAMAESCVRLNCGQEKFMQMMFDGLNCETDEDKKKLVRHLAMLPGHIGLKTTELKKVNYHGSLLLQNMLKFSDTKCIETSLLSMEPAEIVIVSCDPCGSHVIDAVYQSSAVDPKTVEVLIKKLQDSFISLACDRNGSRTLESIWKSVSTRLKSQIATSLCKHESRLQSDRSGFHIHRNFALFHFSRRKEDWVNIQENNSRKRKMFHDFLGSDKSSNKRKNKKQRKKEGQTKGL